MADFQLCSSFPHNKLRGSNTSICDSKLVFSRLEWTFGRISIHPPQTYSLLLIAATEWPHLGIGWYEMLLCCTSLGMPINTIEHNVCNTSSYQNNTGSPTEKLEY